MFTSSAHADVTMDDMSIPRSGNITDLLKFTPKIPPAFNGSISFFKCEEALDEWCDITTLDPEKRGPMLKSRLCGGAEKYKPTFDRERLKDHDEGVQYFKDVLRQNYLKGS